MVKKIGRTALRSCSFHRGAEAAGRHDGQPNAARWQRLDALWKEKHRGRHSSNKSEMLSPLSDGNASGSLDGSRSGRPRADNGANGTEKQHVVKEVVRDTGPPHHKQREHLSMTRERAMLMSVALPRVARTKL